MLRKDGGGGIDQHGGLILGDLAQQLGDQPVIGGNAHGQRHDDAADRLLRVQFVTGWVMRFEFGTTIWVRSKVWIWVARTAIFFTTPCWPPNADPVADDDGPLDQQDDARDEVRHHLLHAETDADRQRTGDEGQRGQVDAGRGDGKDRREREAPHGRSSTRPRSARPCPAASWAGSNCGTHALHEAGQRIADGKDDDGVSIAMGDRRTPPKLKPCCARDHASARSLGRAPQIRANSGSDSTTSAKPTSAGISASRARLVAPGGHGIEIGDEVLQDDEQPDQPQRHDRRPERRVGPGHAAPPQRSARPARRSARPCPGRPRCGCDSSAARPRPGGCGAGCCTAGTGKAPSRIIRKCQTPAEASLRRWGTVSLSFWLWNPASGSTERENSWCSAIAKASIEARNAAWRRVSSFRGSGSEPPAPGSKGNSRPTSQMPPNSDRPAPGMDSSSGRPSR